MPIKTLLLATSLSMPLLAAAQPATLPKLDLLMMPHQHGAEVDAIGVRLTIDNPHLAPGASLLTMPTYAVSIDVPAYAADAIEARDDAGPLTLTVKEGEPDPSMVFRDYLVGRATVGNVVVRYTGKPRAVDAHTRNGPLYDLRAEAGGLLGAGMYFLALPADERRYQITLDWDLSQAAPGTRGVWSLGEGRQTLAGTSGDLFQSGFAIGPVKSLPADGRGPFALYWLSEPPFDMARLAADTQAMYRAMASFFQDQGTTYRIFARRNPYPSSGGSGWTRSFVFGYGSDGANADDQKLLLTHEMVHNWPRLDDNDLSTTAWYTEGTAEYYTAVLLYRNQSITLDKFAELVNKHTEDYMTSPFIHTSNQQAGEQFWSDTRAQRLPYVRGFLYFLRLNAQLREHTQGRRGVDDLVLEVLRRQRAGQQVRAADWRTMVVGELGEPAGRDYDDMVSGKLIEPPASALAPCLARSLRQVRAFDLGFDEMSHTVVRRLRAGSQAALAGLAEGDQIASMDNLQQARKDETGMLSLLVTRDGQQRRISYLPRAQPAPVWRWTVSPASAAARCGF
ncbi:hypothetical protein FHW58_001948 [Duganella sp. 1224]|uniref:hypothetical protein n=1 Tax=Duganella sp. 1224 TaxID=2587052 RepID=UPI0015C7E882|nr:hypothetical protein [Duganella sp. 1224]NYE60796.1 hypothetical protein [Duganella sp. 1224]